MIRKATLADIESITRIYNESIVEGGYTGDLVALSVEDRMAWYICHQNNYSVFVKEKDGVVIGYIALSPYRKGRLAFSGACEISYYLLRDYRGHGFGNNLIEYAINYALEVDFHLIVAIVLDCNKRSTKLLEKYGFLESGRLPMAAKIDEKYIDHVYLSHLLVRQQQQQSSF